MNTTVRLSKSSYISGKQCHKKLYLQKKHPDLAAPQTAQTTAILQQGTSIGELAQKRFSGGTDVSPEHYYDFSNSIQQTKDLIENGAQNIYEAAFTHENILAALDIWHKEGDEVWAIEVKSSTEVKPYHIDDAAVQYWIMNNSGHKPNRMFIMFVNNQYVLDGELNIAHFFTLQEVTNEVISKQTEVETIIPELREMLSDDQMPAKDIGEHCFNPFDCEFKEHCWSHIPKHSVFNLGGIRKKKAFEYYQAGKIQYADLIHENGLNDKNKTQVSTALNQEVIIAKEGIQNFLNTIEYPLYFFDFETINPAIPLYQGTKPFEQVGVQYSLHVKEHRGSELIHKEHLSEFAGDPREPMILQMLEDLGTQGTIIAYNMSFEQRVISSLARAFPQYQAPLEALNERFIDLIIPFRNYDYYHYKMHGSASIKSVLPALFPNNTELSYKALNIGEGGSASAYLKAMAEGTVDKNELEQIRKDLLAYCRLDTLAMVRILEKLEAIE